MATVTTEKAQVEGIKTGIRCAQWYTISVLIRSKIHHYINVLVQTLHCCLKHLWLQDTCTGCLVEELYCNVCDSFWWACSLVETNAGKDMSVGAVHLVLHIAKREMILLHLTWAELLVVLVSATCFVHLQWLVCTWAVPHFRRLTIFLCKKTEADWPLRPSVGVCSKLIPNWVSSCSRKQRMPWLLARIALIA